jgi:phosphoribosylformimino-5-aminoimidazole carboxamide ribotide isomerase
LGLESFHAPGQLAEVLQASPRETVVFSLDLKDGRPIADPSQWPSDPIQLANFACERGVDQLIILDLAAVGMQNGLATAELCRAVREKHPQLTLITGGGIRSAEEIEAAVAFGANQVLVATALHDGGLLPSFTMLQDRHVH